MDLKNSIETVFSGFPITKQNGKSQMSAITGRLLCTSKGEFQYQLENCLAQFFSFFAGCRVTGSEIHYESEKDTYVLKGDVDCILENTSEGKYIIVDFKLKWLPKRDDCTGDGENGLSNFQLPMYITLTEENENIIIDTALFYSIIDLKVEVVIGAIQDAVTKKVIPKKEDERIIPGGEWYNRIFNEFNEKVLQFSKEISSGEFSVFETNQNNCYTCSYHRICRTTYIINRQNIGKHQ
jgi:CRISPR/Cas system-associated exonuclease Cas4 (RecB family)